MTTEDQEATSLDVVVSIASHDSVDTLLECLSTIPSACKGLRWDVTVVQNIPPSEDPAIENQFPWAKVVRNAYPQGFGANHNTVLTPLLYSERARYALVLNDDTQLSPSSITALVAHANANPDVGVVGPLTYWPDGKEQPTYYSFPTRSRSLIASVFPRVTSSTPTTRGQGWLRGSCLLFRLAALSEIGLFDTRFFLFFEDIDICARLWKANWKVAVCDDAAITHSAHTTVSRSDLIGAMERQLLRSQYLYHRKYNGRLFAYILSQWNRLGLLARAGGRAVSRPDPHSPRRTGILHLVRLATYRPSRPLPHESSPNSSTSATRGFVQNI